METWLGKINRRSEELAPFLQAWLFFGLIACCLNTQINVNDFTRVSEDGQRKFITTAKLEVYFANFFSRFLPPENDDERERVFAEREEKTAEFRATMKFLEVQSNGKTLQILGGWKKYISSPLSSEHYLLL